MNAITLNIIIAIVAVVVTVFIAVPISSKAAITKKFQKDDEQIGIAEEKARNIINEALKTAEAKKREAFLEAQEENLKIKNEQDREYRERRWELQKYEQRVLCKEESIDRKAEVLERRGNDLVVQEEELKKKEKKIDD